MPLAAIMSHLNPADEDLTDAHAAAEAALRESVSRIGIISLVEKVGGISGPGAGSRLAAGPFLEWAYACTLPFHCQGAFLLGSGVSCAQARCR